MARSRSADPLMGFKFRVGIPGLPAAYGFAKVSGLTREIGVVDYDEGGYDTTHKLSSGREKFEPIVLEKGKVDTRLEALYLKSLRDGDFRGIVTISMMDASDVVVKTWSVQEAWVQKYEGPALDASQDAVAVEKITIQHEGFLD